MSSDQGVDATAASVAGLSVADGGAAPAPDTAAPAAAPADAPAAPASASAAVPTADAPGAAAKTQESHEAHEAHESGEPVIPSVELNGTTYKPLADGVYDVIVLSTGLKECVLAGLLSVRGLKVLQIDRNAYYGGQCASLNLKELHEKHGKPYDDEATQQKYGRSRDYCVDAVPKLLMANGKLVKMLIQTGVTRYMDFNGIAGSFVYNTGKIYKLPVTGREALTSSLVSLMQKNPTRKFADYLKSYRAPKRVAGTLSKEDFQEVVLGYYRLHNPSKVADVPGLLGKFDAQRELLVRALEQKYGLPVFPETTDVSFGPGSLGLGIEGQTVKKQAPAGEGGPVTTVVVVTKFLPVAPAGAPAGTPAGKGPAEASGRVAPGDVISAVQGESVLGLSDQEVKSKIVAAPRPLALTFMKPVVDTSKQEYDLLSMTMRELYGKFGLNDTTQNFLGHAMALQTNDSYLDQPAEPTVLACQLYGQSVGRYGQESPYLYPNYGLSSLPEGFSRLAAIHGGTVMLRTEVDEIVMSASSGQAVGVRSGDMAASAKFVIGDASYFPPAMSKKTGQVVRSVCLLGKPIKGTVGDSAQIILPARHLVGKQQDVYLSELSEGLHVTPKGVFVAIASTTVETDNPVAELRQATDLLGTISERFDSVTDTFAPADDGKATKCFVVSSLDATSHFESAAQDILRVYRSIFNKELNLDEKLVEEQPQ